jgi:hypothetical protein
MNLKEFIQTTLTEISEGVKAAQASVTDTEFNPAVRPNQASNSEALVRSGRFVDAIEHRIIEPVEFDVAVTAEEGERSGGKMSAGISVLSASFGGGSDSRNSTVSRIKFSVLMKLPKKV